MQRLDCCGHSVSREKRITGHRWAVSAEVQSQLWRIAAQLAQQAAAPTNCGRATRGRSASAGSLYPQRHACRMRTACMLWVTYNPGNYNIITKLCVQARSLARVSEHAGEGWKGRRRTRRACRAHWMRRQTRDADRSVRCIIKSPLPFPFFSLSLLLLLFHPSSPCSSTQRLDCCIQSQARKRACTHSFVIL